MILYFTIIFITLLIPFIIYLIYGREEFHETDLIYQKEPPTHDHPVIVNAICCDSESIVGMPNLYGFKACMYELVRKGFLEFVEYDKNIIFDFSLKRFIFRINYDYLEIHKTELLNFEKEMIEIFESIGENGIVEFENVSKTEFKTEFNRWRTVVSEYLDNSGELNKYYISKGADIALGYGLLCFFISIGIIAVCLIYQIDVKYYNIIFYFVLYFICLGFICGGLPSGIFGKWTKYGVEYREKWNKFSLFLQDFSVIDEYSPKYMKLWNELWVYSIAIEMNRLAPPKLFWSTLDEFMDN